MGGPEILDRGEGVGDDHPCGLGIQVRLGRQHHRIAHRMTHDEELGRRPETRAGEGVGGGRVLAQVHQAGGLGAVALAGGVEHQAGDAMAPEQGLDHGPARDGLVEAVIDQDRRWILAVGGRADEVAVQTTRMAGDRHPFERHALAGGGLRPIGPGAEGILADRIDHRGASRHGQDGRAKDDPAERRAPHQLRPPVRPSADRPAGGLPCASVRPNRGSGRSRR